MSTYTNSIYKYYLPDNEVLATDVETAGLLGALLDATAARPAFRPSVSKQAL
jgi:hypothetical protein